MSLKIRPSIPFIFSLPFHCYLQHGDTYRNYDSQKKKNGTSGLIRGLISIIYTKTIVYPRLYDHLILLRYLTF